MAYLYLLVERRNLVGWTGRAVMRTAGASAVTGWGIRIDGADSLARRTELEKKGKVQSTSGGATAQRNERAGRRGLV